MAASVAAQSLDAKNAKILKEQRFDAGDGRFGAAFAAEDGTVFREKDTRFLNYIRGRTYSTSVVVVVLVLVAESELFKYTLWLCC